jgi:uncharacterized protein (DUF2147 family)
MSGARRVRWAAAAALLSAGGAAAAAPPAATGFWVTQDHQSVVEISACYSGLCGRLVGLRRDHPAGLVPTDMHNPDASKAGEPLCGLILMGAFKPAEGESGKWDDGWVYDPDSGRTYSGEMAIDTPDTLKLRGFVGISLFGRSEVWTREAGTPNRCSPPPG